MQFHACGLQRGLDRRREIIVAQCQQHLCPGSTGTRAGHRLVGTLATGKGAELTAQHGFAGCRHMRGAHHEIKIGRAGDKNGGGHGIAW